MTGADGNHTTGQDHDADYYYSYDYDRQPWRLEFRDIPEAGTRSAVTSRSMASASLPRGDVMMPMNAWGYRSVAERSYTYSRSIFPPNVSILTDYDITRF